MQKFPIKSIFIDRTRKVRLKQGPEKVIYDFQTLMPGIHFDQSFLNVGGGVIKLEYKKLDFVSIEPCIQGLENTFTVSAIDPWKPEEKITFYLSGRIEEFNQEFHHVQLELGLVA